MKHLFKKYFLLIPIIAVLSACGTATNVVNNHPVKLDGVHSISVVEADPTINVPSAMRQYLLNAVETEVYDKQGFERGDDLTLQYQIVSYKHGDRLERWLSDGLGNWGEGGLMVKTTFTDINGNVVGTLNTRGKVESGIFGGSMKFAVARVAENIAQYTNHSYR